MKELKKKFLTITQENPWLSSYVCFCRTIQGAKIERKLLRRAFNLLVDKEDYDKLEKEEVYLGVEKINLENTTQK